MSVKYILFAIAVMVLYFQIEGYTSDESTLNRSLDNYKTALLEKDVETVVDYLYPALYNKKASKELLYEKQEKLFEKNTITDINLIPILPIKTYSEGVYILVKYSKIMTMEIDPLGAADNDKRKRRMLLFFLRDSLKKGDTFNVDEDNNIINIEKHGTFIFLNKAKSGWKYIDIESTPKRLFREVLPIDIIDKEQVLILKQRDTMFQELFQKKVRK